MSVVTDLYQSLFGKDHIKDGDVIDFSEHGRVGGVSTGQGFKFVSGIDEAVLFEQDSTTSTTSYLGTAAIGATTSAAVWKILEIDTSSGASIKYADGDSNYDNIWDNRESLTYE